MSTNSTIQVVWSTVGDGVNEVGNETITLSGSAAQKLFVPLTIGRNQIFLPGPPTMNAALIVPPAFSTNAKTWDASGAVGGGIGTVNPSFISLPSGATSFWIGSAGTETIVVYVF